MQSSIKPSQHPCTREFTRTLHTNNFLSSRFSHIPPVLRNLVLFWGWQSFQSYRERKIWFSTKPSQSRRGMSVITQETSHELTENLLMLWSVGLSHLSPDALSRAQQLSISWWTLGLNYHELLLLTHSSLSFPKIPFLKQRWLQCICWNNLITMEGLTIDQLPSGRSASFPLLHYASTCEKWGAFGSMQDTTGCLRLGTQVVELTLPDECQNVSAVMDGRE